MGQAAGNATEAAKLAGYSARSATVTASRLLTKANIRSAIDARQQADPLIATREERLQFLSVLMRQPDAHPLARLKACDQLSKIGGDYLERHEHTGEIRVSWAS